MAEVTEIVENTKQDQRGSWINYLIAGLVAFYGITTAAAAYFGNQVDGNANEAYFNGVAFLNDANSLYLESLILEVDDLRILDEVAIQEAQGADPDLIAYIEAGLSLPAAEALERSGFTDEQYYDELYSFADEAYTNATDLFTEAEQLNQTADSYQLVVLVLAVGLSFVAWASLGSGTNIVRVLFVVMAIGIYVVGLLGLLLLLSGG